MHALKLELFLEVVPSGAGICIFHGMRFPNSIVFLALHALLAVGNAFSWDLGAASGESTFKYLKLSPSPRTSGLAGAGLAKSTSATDAMSHPIGALSAQKSWVAGSQLRLSEKIGATYNSLQIVEPFRSFGQLKIFVGGDFLVVDPLQGRDEDGFVTGDFGANAWNARLGAAQQWGAWKLGAQATYTHASIAETSAQGFLGDLQIGVNALSWLSVSAQASHLGWSDTEDPTPLIFQLGWAAETPQLGQFAPTILLDFRREIGAKFETIVGLETIYAKILVLRLGMNLGEKLDEGKRLPSAGLALLLGHLEASYAYIGAPMDSQLKGNHQFGLAVGF